MGYHKEGYKKYVDDVVAVLMKCSLDDRHEVETATYIQPVRTDIEDR